MRTPSVVPRKTRELHSHHFDSTIWNDLRFRDDDIVISTYAKSGTTWMQQIIAQMLFGGDPELEVAEMSPWLDLRVPPKEVKLPDRRGADAPALSEDASAGRCARLLAEGAIHLHRARRSRRGVEHLQPSRERERSLVCGAERHAGARRSADRAAARRHSAVLARLDGPRRLSVLAVLGERSVAGGRSAICRTCCSSTSRL